MSFPLRERPIPDANVELHIKGLAGANLLGFGASGSDGSFSFVVRPYPSRGYMLDPFLTVSAKGWASTRIDHVYKPWRSYSMGEVVLHAPVTVQGVLTDEESRPVPSAHIYAVLGPVSLRDRAHTGLAPIATSDSQGTFQCDGLPPGVVTFGVAAEGFADLVFQTRLSASETANMLEAMLERGKPTRVRTLSTSGDPIQGASVEPSRGWTSPYSRNPAPIAFWRKSAESGDDGWILIEGLPIGVEGEVRVLAPGHRPELFDVSKNDYELLLEPVSWVNVVVRPREDGSTPELFELAVRDGPGQSGFSMHGDEPHTVRLWNESAAVEALAPSHWRVEWNSKASYSHGGQPTHVKAIATDGTHASADIAEDMSPGLSTFVELEFPESASLAGVVQDIGGHPVSMKLESRIFFRGRASLVAKSDNEGRFAFDRVRGSWQRLYSLDPTWEIIRGSGKVNLEPGQSIEDWGVVVAPRPRRKGGTGSWNNHNRRQST